MPGIDPRIVEHEIKTYPNTKPIQQRLHAVNPRKAPTIKAEIEKLLKVLGNRADPGLILLYRTNKRPTVLALSATTCAQVAVSPETARGAVESGFYKQKRDITVPLVFNNL